MELLVPTGRLHSSGKRGFTSLGQPSYNSFDLYNPGDTTVPNIAAVLKDEIRRLAKREIKTATSTTKQAIVQYRRDIAKLKRELQEQKRKTAFLEAQEQSGWTSRRPPPRAS